MKSNQLAHASFIVAGDRVSPDFWTKYFGVAPDVAAFKGEPIADPTGQDRKLRRRTGVWAVGSQSAVHSDSLEPHLRYLVGHLSLPRADLREAIAHAGARVRFFCYWDNETGDRLPDVPDDVRTMMESLGGTIEIDEYR